MIQTNLHDMIVPHLVHNFRMQNIFAIFRMRGICTMYTYSLYFCTKYPPICFFFKRTKYVCSHTRRPRY